MEPITFEPILKRIRWGGQKLGTILGKATGPETDYAESWEIADHADGQSIVADGPRRGWSLRQLLQDCGSEILGTDDVPDRFPLLIKFLDANDWLSLQVHPNDTQAAEYDATERGKTEAWVIVDAAPGSEICAGLQEGVTQSDLEQALHSGELTECLHRYQVHSGDCIFIPAGTIHAIGPGVLLAEVQQQSNLTFRLHDWGRLGQDGKPRPLHIEQALACTDFARGPVNPTATATDGAGIQRVIDCDYFHVNRHHAVGRSTIETGNAFRIIMVLAGAVEIETRDGRQTFPKGSTMLIPAACESVDLTPRGTATFLEIAAGPCQ